MDWHLAEIVVTFCLTVQNLTLFCVCGIQMSSAFHQPTLLWRGVYVEYWIFVLILWFFFNHLKKTQFLIGKKPFWLIFDIQPFWLFHSQIGWWDAKEITYVTFCDYNSDAISSKLLKFSFGANFLEGHKNR